MKFKTLKQSDKIRLVIGTVTLSLTVKQAVEQFLDGGKVVRFLQLFDKERLKYPNKSERVLAIATIFEGENLQVDLY